MKFKIIIIIILFTSLLNSCNEDNSNGTEENKEETRTILAYFVADNSLNDYVQTDINELIKGYSNIYDTKRNNLLIYLDNYKTPYLLHITKNNGKIATDTIESYNEQNSLDPDIMSGIINKALNAYQADSYGLVLWSHGSGWTPTIVVSYNNTMNFGEDKDNNKEAAGNHMNIFNLRKALERCPKFDFIMFDACLMQGIEVAYELKSCTDYIIGSAAEIPSDGAPYNYEVTAFFSKENKEENITRTFYNYYKENYINDTSRYKSYKGYAFPYGINLSLVDCNKLPALASATKKILTKYIKRNETIETGDIVSYDDNYFGLYYDLGNFIKKITNANPDYIEWKSTYDNTVKLFLSTEHIYSSYANKNQGGISYMTNSTGLSTYIPNNENFTDAYYWAHILYIFPQYYGNIIELRNELNGFYANFKWYNDAGWDQTGW